MIRRLRLPRFGLACLILSASAFDCEGTSPTRLRAIHPIYAPEHLVYEPRLVGLWHTGSGERLAAIYIQSLGAGKYELRRHSRLPDVPWRSRPEAHVTTVHLAAIGDHLFFDEVLSSDPLPQVPGAVVHGIQVLRIAADTVLIYSLLGRFRDSSAWPGDPVPRIDDDGFAVLRGSVSDMHNFLARYVADSATLSEPEILTRAPLARGPAFTMRTSPIMDDDAGEALRERQDVPVIEVGDSVDQFHERHAARARFLPIASLVQDTVSWRMPSPRQLRTTFEAVGVRTDKPVVVIAGHLTVQAWAFAALEIAGKADSIVLMDRSQRDTDEIGPPPPPARGHISGPFEPGRAITSAELRRLLGTPNVLVVDVRPEAQFLGDSAGHAARAGRIPGAVNLDADDSDDLTDFLLKVPEDVRAVIVYGSTGPAAIDVYLWSRWLGHPVRFYEGGFNEWSRDPRLPIERGPAVAGAER